jgi:deazaflavin-dependent oxidoreductase (nitroreductase family)
MSKKSKILEQPEWVKDHITKYVESNGKDGHIFNGNPTLLLTTIGRRSGKPYTTPVIYGQHENTYLIVGSRGGDEHHPHWYLNLVDNPKVRLQIEADQYSATARTANEDEKPALWKIMTQIYPAFDERQANTDREFPLVILELD